MIGNKKTPMGMDAPSTDAVNRIVEGFCPGIGSLLHLSSGGPAKTCGSRVRRPAMV